jgi:RNA polymerase sigma factor (sigma-70 family)
MWEQTERSPALVAPGSKNYSGLIASSTINSHGSEADNFQALSDDEANDLCQKYEKLAYKIAGQYGGRGIALDERRSAALVGLLVASRKYDPQKGPFGPYAKPWIRGEVTALFKKAARHRGKYSLNETIINEDDESEEKSVIIIDENEPVFRPYLGQLEPRERETIEARSDDQSLQSVGQKLGGLSAERVRQIEVRALSRLRREKGDPVNVALGDIDARLFCDEHRTYHGDFLQLEHRKGYRKPKHQHLDWSFFGKVIEDAREKPRPAKPVKEIQITAHLSGAEKKKWVARLRNAVETDWGRKTEGYEKRFARAVDGANGPHVSWKRLRETCGSNAVEIAERKTPEQHLHKFLTHHQLERFRFYCRAKLCSGTKVKKPRKGSWCNAAPIRCEREPVIFVAPSRLHIRHPKFCFERHRNEGLSQANGVPRSYEPEMSRQLEHHRRLATALREVRP